MSNFTRQGIPDRKNNPQKKEQCLSVFVFTCGMHSVHQSEDEQNFIHTVHDEEDQTGVLRRGDT